jgi:hypothetical protein
MSKLQYLPYVIPYALGIYGLLVATIYYRFRVSFNRNKIRNEVQRHETAIGTPYHLHPITAFFSADHFEVLYSMNDMWRVLPGNNGIDQNAAARLNRQREKTTMYALLFWRVINLLYFFGVSFLWGYIYFHGNNSYFFTIWNIDIICLYYFLMVIATSIGIYYDDDLQEHKRLFAKGDVVFWSDRIITFGYILQIMYAFVGATALFITVVAFSTLEHRFVIWNVSFHFVTSVSFVFDAMLNNLRVRWEHLAMNISWIFLYLIFIWSMVGSGTLQTWPYFFLNTDTVGVFVWYPLLFVMNIVFYGLWMGINNVKRVVAKHKVDSHLKNEGMQSIIDFERKDFLSPLVGGADDRHRVDLS